MEACKYMSHFVLLPVSPLTVEPPATPDEPGSTGTRGLRQTRSCAKCGGSSGVGRGPGITWGRLAALFAVRPAYLRDPQQPAQTEQQGDAQGHGRADRTSKTPGPATGGQIGEVCFRGRRGTALGGAELPADAIERQARHLSVSQTAGEHIEQDAKIQHPGNERAV